MVVHKMPDKSLKQNKEVQQNWTGSENFDICFCIIFCHCKSSFSGKETGHWASTNLLIFYNFLSRSAT